MSSWISYFWGSSNNKDNKKEQIDEIVLETKLTVDFLNR